jgi:hypothetical protein
MRSPLVWIKILCSSGKTKKTGIKSLFLKLPVALGACNEYYAQKSAGRTYAMSAEAEISVKDIINFYIKINDSSKAKKDIAQLSSKDKAAAFEIMDASSAPRDFKIDMAKHFIHDLDNRVRRKAEILMETLVPGWVADPGESILKLLKSGAGKGGAHRNSAVKFLFGILDSNSLRDTFMVLLNSRNRAHMSEIIAILEEYIDASKDEQEQVKIFDGCLDIVLSDDADFSIKHHACNLLSVFFKKVATTQLGEVLRQKFIEKQVEKGEAVYRYLCSGISGLNVYFLEDLLRPLNEGGTVYQLKMLTYFRFVLEKIRNNEEVDTILDTYPDYWNRNEPTREEKIRIICQRIAKALEELWGETEDVEVREHIVRIKYGEYVNKMELLEQIKSRIDSETVSDAAREKIALMLRCFLMPGEDETMMLQAAYLLLFKIGDSASRASALKHLKFYVEHRNLNYAEKGSLAAVIESLLKFQELSGELQNTARYILFLTAPDRFKTAEGQKNILTYLRGFAEGEGFGSDSAEERVLESLGAFHGIVTLDKYHKAIQYLEFKIKQPRIDGALEKPKPKK